MFLCYFCFFQEVCFFLHRQLRWNKAPSCSTASLIYQASLSSSQNSSNLSWQARQVSTFVDVAGKESGMFESSTGWSLHSSFTISSTFSTTPRRIHSSWVGYRLLCVDDFLTIWFCLKCQSRCSAYSLELFSDWNRMPHVLHCRPEYNWSIISVRRHFSWSRSKGSWAFGAGGSFTNPAAELPIQIMYIECCCCWSRCWCWCLCRSWWRPHQRRFRWRHVSRCGGWCWLVLYLREVLIH